MDYSLVIPAFIAGVLTFLAPCTLPLVPGYLGFISGVSLDDLKNTKKTRAARRKILLNGFLFVAGFSAVFITLGTLAGFAGASLAPYRLWLGRIGGLFVITFGLFMLGTLRIPLLSRDFRLPAPAFFAPGKSINSLVLGSAFAFGWTPCVGPILGSILLLASTSNTAPAGGFLLTVFSAGLAIPFLVIALGIGSAVKFIARITPLLHAVSIIGGLFLIGLGILLVTDNMGLLISYGYRLFRFIEYGRLLDYL